MSYLVLARRWRPQRFADLVGQDVVVRTLRNALTSHSLAHAYLLTGIRGVGKTTIARLMAMSTNCQHTQGDGEPCGACDACVAIAAGSHLDVRELDAASHTGVDDMRDMLDDVRYPPVNLPYKVYIIDEAHMLSKSAFNALLKTLEEPPERVLFILATTESDKLPVTVRSRCQRFDLRRLGVQEIADYLAHVLDAEQINYEKEAVLTIARSADGSVRDALSLTERVLAFSNQNILAADVRQSLGLVGPEIVQQLSDCIAQGAAAEAISLLRKAVMQGYGARQLVLALLEQWHQLACMMVDTQLLHDEPSEQTQQWLQQAAGCWRAEALDMRYQILLHGLRDLNLVDEQRGSEMLVMRLCHLKVLLEPEHRVASPAEVVLSEVSAGKNAAQASLSKLEQHQSEYHKTTVDSSVLSVVPKPVSHERGRQEGIVQKSVVQKSEVNGDVAQRKFVQETSAPENVLQKTVSQVSVVPESVVQEASEVYATPQPSVAETYADWESVMTAFAKVNPPVTAILEQVQCVSFDVKRIILALDAHQARFLRKQVREDFQTWVKIELVWEKKKASSTVASVADVRQRRKQDAKQQLWQEAEQDVAVKILVNDMDCRLVDVQPAPDKNNGVND